MVSPLNSTETNDNLLVGWKDIAAHMKCSVRKVQRLESVGLPVNRIPGAKSVWASRAEVDGWLKLQAQKAKQHPKTATQLQTSSGHRASPILVAVRLSAIAVLVMLTVGAGLASAYGLATLLFSMTAAVIVLSYPYLPDRRWTRGILGLFLMAGMAYATTATSLPGVVESVANMETLRPALAYPIVVGLRFVPVPIVICAFWILTGLKSDSRLAQRPTLARAFAGVGFVCLSTAAGAGLLSFGTDPIWQSGLSIRWTLFAGECSILVLNAALLWLAYRFLTGRQQGSLWQFLSWCGTTYLLIALTAATINRHWNDVNKRHPDVRQPLEFRVGNPNALSDLQDWLQLHTSEAGPDLLQVTNDPEFIEALQNGKFYRLRFDEPFQFSRKAVVIGYQTGHTTRGREPAFRLIRFPLDLANTLQLK
jgi:hypothetical protein